MNKPSPLILVGVVLLGGLLAYQVTWPKLHTNLEQKQALQTEIASLQADASSLPTEQARATRLNQEMDALKATLPSQEELPDIIDTLRYSATALGLTSKSLARSTHPSTLAGVNAIDFDMDLTGSYPRVQAFVSTLAALKRAYTTRSITISGAADGKVNALLHLTTYWRDEAAKPPVATTPTDGSVPTSGGPTPPSTTPSGGQP